MIGFQEIIIIVIIAAIILGPSIFIKIGKRGKKTADSLKKGIESGAKAAGADVDLDAVNKDTILDGVSKLQNRVDDYFKEAQDDAGDGNATEADATGDSEKQS